MKSWKQGREQRRMRLVGYWLGLLAALMVGLTACGEAPPVEPPPGSDVNPPPKKGQTDFSTTEAGSSFNGSTDGRGETGGMSPGAPSAGAQNDSANKGAAPPPAAPSGRTGTVEEADLYRVEGNLLFYLNTYKGLTIFDLKDAKKPKKLANLPVFGYPIEMFVEGNIAYALVKDALYLLKVNGKFQFHRRHVSQLVTIDISDRSNPKVLQRLDIKGQLREGVSRKIDDTIYVVSYKPRYYWWGWSYEPRDQAPEQATVYSYNIKNPKAVREVGQLDLIQHPDPVAQPTTPNGSTAPVQQESRSFSGVTISATSNTLLVGEKWYHNKYVRINGCSRYENYQEMVMSVIDISDVTGKIKVHTRFKVRGELGDQFKQTYIFDKAKNKGTYFGIFRRQEWKSNGCSRGERLVKNTLVSIDITDGKNPRVLDELVFGKPNETVRGSIFDRDRGVAYAITAVQRDPLYAISFKDPKNLKILDEVDGLSGDINLFRFIEDRKFLIAVGRDTSGACTGFGTDNSGTKVAVSIIDVRDLSKIRLVQRKCVAVDGAKWSQSAVNSNLDQAHKMIGMYQNGKTNLITLPVSYYTRSNRGRWWWGQYKSAIGIMNWDLSKYDDTKDEKNQNVLENIATMEHPKGAVKRTIIVNMDQNGTKKRMVINLSDTHISIIDLDDLRKPSLMSTFEIAPYVRSVYRFGKYFLEQVTLGTGDNRDYNEFRVKALGSDPNDAPIISRFVVGRIQRVVRWKNLLLLFRYHMDVAKSAAAKRGVYDHQKSDLLIYDLTDPKNPKERGDVTLPFPFIPHYYYFCGSGFFYDFGGYFYSRSSFIKTGTGIASLYRHYKYDQTNRSQTTTTKMFFLDVTNPDKPALQEKKVNEYTNNYNNPNGTTQVSHYYYNLNRLDDDRFYITSRTFQRTYKTGVGTTYSVSRYFAQPWSLDGKNWKAGNKLNVPGRLVKAYRSGNKVKLLTQDYGYVRRSITQADGRVTYRYQNINRLYLLEEDGKVARLKDFHVFKSWYLRNMQIDGERLYMAAQRDWYFMSKSPNNVAEKGDQLLIFDLKNNTFKQLLARSTRTYNMQVMGVKAGRLFINLPGEGLLVADVKDPANPKGLHFERTLGWLSHIEFDGDFALAAAGHFGIYQINMTKSTIPAL